MRFGPETDRVDTARSFLQTDGCNESSSTVLGRLAVNARTDPVDLIQQAVGNARDLASGKAMEFGPINRC